MRILKSTCLALGVAVGAANAYGSGALFQCSTKDGVEQFSISEKFPFGFQADLSDPNKICPLNGKDGLVNEETALFGALPLMLHKAGNQWIGSGMFCDQQKAKISDVICSRNQFPPHLLSCQPSPNDPPALTLLREPNGDLGLHHLDSGKTILFQGEYKLGDFTLIGGQFGQPRRWVQIEMNSSHSWTLQTNVFGYDPAQPFACQTP